MDDPHRSLDQLGLRGGTAGLQAKIGGVDLGPAVLGGQQRSKVNELPTTTLKLDATLLAGQPVDYFGLVQIAPTTGTPGFTGNVVGATPKTDGLELECQVHPSLTETLVGGLESVNCDSRELIYLMTRTGGLSEEQINIGGLDDLLLEAIEVLIPLSGLTVTTPVRLGALSLLDPSETAALLEPFSQSEMREVIEGAQCHALYRGVNRRMLVVEQDALHAVDVLLAWAATRARYGLAYLPDGQPQRFRRAKALSQPKREDVVLSRGLDSGRTWLRGLSLQGPDEQIGLTPSDGDWAAPVPDALNAAQQLALAALRRATLLENAVERVQALWEAIEFYVADVRPARRFSDAEARRVRKKVPSDIDPELRQRVMDLLAKINDAPLMAKLREAAHRNGVPLTETEMELLARIRRVRNDTAHGRAAEVPPTEDLEYAVSVVARLLLHDLPSVMSAPPLGAE